MKPRIFKRGNHWVCYRRMVWGSISVGIGLTMIDAYQNWKTSPFVQAA